MIIAPLYSILYTSLILVAPPAALPLGATRLNIGELLYPESTHVLSLPSSFTFTEVQEQTDQVWYFQRYSVVKEYYERPALAPPLIIIIHIYYLGKYLRQKCYRCCTPGKWDKKGNDFSKCCSVLHKCYFCKGYGDSSVGYGTELVTLVTSLP